MKRFIYVLIFLLAVVVIVTQLAEVGQIVDTLRRGLWYWLALAVGVQALYLVNLAAGYGAAFRTVGVEKKMSALLPLVIAANFINVVTASGGLAGMALFAGDARRRKQSAARVTVGGVLYVLFDYAGFLLVLAVGFTVLIRRNDLNAADVVAAGVLVAIATGLGLLLYLGLRSQQALEHALVVAARAVNWVLRPFVRRDYLSEATAHEFAADAAEGFAEMRGQPWQRWVQPLIYTVTGKALLIAILMLAFLAFRQSFTAGTLIAGFSLAYLFFIVSPTPSGLGFVEGAMPLALSSLRVPLGSAVVITLTYRAVTFWLPFLYGFLALRWLGRDTAEPLSGAPGPALDEADV